MFTTAIAFEGNLVADPDQRYTSTGRPVAELTVLVNQRTRTDSGDWTDAEPTRHVVKAFGQLGENTASSLTKGDRVIVAGRMVTDSWQDKSSGQRRTAPRVIAEAVGPSLRWATTQITKATRDSSTDQSE